MRRGIIAIMAGREQPGKQDEGQECQQGYQDEDAAHRDLYGEPDDLVPARPAR